MSQPGEEGDDMNHDQQDAELPHWTSPVTREYEVAELEGYTDTNVAFISTSGCCCDIDL